MILPKWWRGYMLMQGILNPILDRAMGADDDYLKLMRRADEPERAADRGGIEHTAGKATDNEYAKTR